MSTRSLDEFDSFYKAMEALSGDDKLRALSIPPGDHWIEEPCPVISKPVVLMGFSPQTSRLMLSPDLSGGALTLSESWMADKYLSGNVTLDPSAKAGVTIANIGFVGRRDVKTVQNVLALNDRNDFVRLANVSFDYVHGSALSIGRPMKTAFGYTRESDFDNVRIRNCGAPGAPSLDITSFGAGDACNNLFFRGLKVVFSHDGPGIRIRNDAGRNWVRNLFFSGGMVHGIENGSEPGSNVLIEGRVSHLFMRDFSNNASQKGYYSYHFTADSKANAPTACTIDGSMPSGHGGIFVEYGKLLDFKFTAMGTEADITTGPNAGEMIKVTVNGPAETVSYKLDPAYSGAIYRPVYFVGETP